MCFEINSSIGPVSSIFLRGGRQRRQTHAILCTTVQCLLCAEFRSARHRGSSSYLGDTEANARTLSSTLYNWRINDNYACKNEFNLLLLKTWRSLCSWRARQLNLQPHIDDVEMNEQEVVSCICRTQATWHSPLHYSLPLFLPKCLNL